MDDQIASRPIWPGHSEMEGRLNPVEMAQEALKLANDADDLRTEVARRAANDAARKCVKAFADPGLFHGDRGNPSSLSRDEQLVINALIFASQAFAAMEDKTEEEQMAFLRGLRPLYRLIAARPVMRQIKQPRPAFA